MIRVSQSTLAGCASKLGEGRRAFDGQSLKALVAVSHSLETGLIIPLLP